MFNYTVNSKWYQIKYEIAVINRSFENWIEETGAVIYFSGNLEVAVSNDGINFEMLRLWKSQLNIYFVIRGETRNL